MLDIKVLYIEDDELTRKVLKQQLSREFSSVHTAANGKEGLEKYNEVMPDIIVTDLAMPVMSGFEMIEIIRKNDNKIPIIVVSAYREEVEGLEVDATVNKPVDYNEVYDAIVELSGKS